MNDVRKQKKARNGVGSGELVRRPTLEIVETYEECYHGVRDGETIYHIFKQPFGIKRYAATYYSSGRAVPGGQADTLRELGAILSKRCCA